MRIFSVDPPREPCALRSTQPLIACTPGISPGVKAAGAYDWRPATLVMPNVKKIRDLNLPETPWATSACCGMNFTFIKDENLYRLENRIASCVSDFTVNILSKSFDSSWKHFITPCLFQIFGISCHGVCTCQADSNIYTDRRKETKWGTNSGPTGLCSYI